MPHITVAVCCYNGAQWLPTLLPALQSLSCPIAFRVLVIDNNSTDGSATIVQRIAAESTIPIDTVSEPQQGIPYARNRALTEAMRTSDYLAFIDVDEIPNENWLCAAVDALTKDDAECVGGRISVLLPQQRHPDWLIDEVLAFYGLLDHADEPFWIDSDATPVWSGNVAYQLALFADGLRFDERYNRAGDGIGGGSDGIMFQTLLERGARIRYRPDMLIEHRVEDWKVSQSYFAKLHFIAGRKQGEFQTPLPGRTLCGIAPYMVRQSLRQAGRTMAMYLRRDAYRVRQLMNLTHSVGVLIGRVRRWRRGDS
ncbi:MAG: glycosyltransferase [Pseudomonadota bacterium]